MHVAAPVGFAGLAQRCSGGWQMQELELAVALPNCALPAAARVPWDRAWMCRCPRAQAGPVLLGEMGNEKRVQHDSGVCCGSIESISFFVS